MKDTFIRVFVGTSWDLYFLWKDSRYKSKDINFISSDIKDYLGFLIEEQGYETPNLHEMVEDLRFYSLGKQEDSIFSCKAKDDFVEKYAQLFSNTLKSKN